MSDDVAYLEHFPAPGVPPQRVVMRTFPFRIGRGDAADHVIASRQVSGLHAEIDKVGDGFVVRDLGSKNGTFVNGARVTEHPLSSGDVLHVAFKEMRFVVGAPRRRTVETTLASFDGDREFFFDRTQELVAIFERRAVTTAFQPIVTLADARTIGYEALGRLAVTTCTIGEMLHVATVVGQGAQLSRLLRERALSDTRRVPERPTAIFFNFHPAELKEPRELEASFAAMAVAMDRGQRAVLEIHEGAVIDLPAMRQIRERLSSHGIGLAYDDFGAGRSRLMELVEVPPDYLKLDMSLVRDIDRNERRQDLVRAMVSVMRDLGIEVLAEGIETRGEAETCRALGCTLGQGYLFGRPAPLP